ncbi:MAG: DNA alkylation repair protein [Lachnospiraceae bacterium]
MMDIQDRVKALADEGNAEFQARLTPTIPREKFLGTRVPNLRKLAKEMQGTKEMEEFLRALPHEYCDENVLHSIFLCNMKDLEECLAKVESFLPYIDNWSVCDTLRPLIFKKHTKEVKSKVVAWIASKEVYTCRFGINCLMSFYLEKEFEPNQHKLVAAIQTEEYYVNMMSAWYFATALAKQWDATIIYLEENRLPQWVHNKTIQKAIESYRITPQQKEYLRNLRRKPVKTKE